MFLVYISKKSCKHTNVKKLIRQIPSWTLKYKQFYLPKSLVKSGVCVFPNFERQITSRHHTQEHWQHLTCINIAKRKILTFAPPGWDPKINPDDQNRPKGPPGPLPAAMREASMFLFHFWPLQGPLGTTWGPPGAPRDLHRDTQWTTKDPHRMPKDPQGIPKRTSRPPKTPERSPGSTKERYTFSKNNKS